LFLIVEVYIWWKLQISLIILSKIISTISGWLNTFWPYCISNPSPIKQARKRENEQSPIKKKFKDSANSKEELDADIVNGIKLALQEQQHGLDVAIASAVREAILVPALRDLRIEIQKTNETVKEISSELRMLAKST